ncbi:NAD-dependent deacetylase [Chloroflexota bacterium]
MKNDLHTRIEALAQLMFEAKRPVFFTGAGISTDSGLPDFRGPDGVWTHQSKGFETAKFNWTAAMPNPSHLAIVELQNMGKLFFLITQNVDNLHLKSGIKPELLAELHGNNTKLRCQNCGFYCDYFPDLTVCPICEGQLVSSVVDLGNPLPLGEFSRAEERSRQTDLFIVAGSSLVVYPAANMPRLALEAGAKLIIINNGETPIDSKCRLRFDEQIEMVLPAAVAGLKKIIGNN